MRELKEKELSEVSGGLAPLAIIGIDLALNGILVASAAYAASNYHNSGGGSGG